jgi:alkylhydroperoxidase/carboxymuconolactone decarboxylase family protein YurZ
MKRDEGVSPSGQLRRSNATVGSAFRSFRETARTAGPLDEQTVELILMAGFSAAGHQEPFKNHAMRALEAGVAKEALQQAVMVTLGATSVLPAVANALRWIDEVYEAYAGK